MAGLQTRAFAFRLLSKIYLSLYNIIDIIVTIHRRSTRLPPQNYTGRQTYFITICCHKCLPHLQSTATATHVLALLFQSAAKHSFRLHAFCLMPDHLHILAEGAHDNSNLREFIRLFKQRTAFAFRQSHNSALWEMSYYDHILRSHDSIEQIATYIWSNPVRNHLCPTPADYPYSGSQTIPWMQQKSRSKM
jgi:REP element-mobilizing transposase RayT